MFETISKGFRDITQRMRGVRELNEANIDEALRAIRASLLEADVNYHVVKRFLNNVKTRALGEEVRVSIKDKQGQVHRVTPGQHFIKICQEELEALMGPVDEDPIKVGSKAPTKIMLVGLQGSGKTTTAAKLAYWLVSQYKARPLMVAGDVYRPAAARQLQILGESIDVPVYHRPDADPVDICTEGINEAKKRGCDFVIFDTAGRLAVDDILMSELSEIVEETDPENILLVCDAMIGRDAVNTAVQFNEKINLDGFIMTKLDGDARGGAALSIKEVTGKPIRFIGEGEQVEKLKIFRPEGISGRILGFGDIVDIMMDFERVVDEERAQKDALEMLSGKFDFHHFLEQLNMIQRMGSLRDIMERMPFFSGIGDKINVDDTEITKIKAMIQSMTEKERRDPDLMFARSRQARVAKGSGRTAKDVADLMQRFVLMRNMMGRLGTNTNWLSKIPGLGQLNNMRQLSNMDFTDLFGSMVESAMPSMDPSQMLPPGLPRGYTPPGFRGQMMSRQPLSKEQKQKRKLARNTRKK
ncbi:MAG: signal recognition particle protein, partial [Proteobacteria bacterium]|nr:signal recognition particle protein [Pseudomonadota bacterium]